jgi:hypothetical protein
VPTDTPAPEASPRRRFIALLDQLDGWLQAEKEKGGDSLAANPALVKSLKDPIPPAPARGQPAPVKPGLLILFIAGPAGSEDGEDLLTRMIAALGMAAAETALVRTGTASERLLQDPVTGARPALAVTLDEDAWRLAAGPEAKPLEKVRGTWQVIGGLDVMPTYGPAHLLKKPADKKLAWKDLQTVLAKLGRTPPEIRK